MLKRLILLVLCLLFARSFASDVIPSHVSASNPDTLGLYQAEDEIILYKKPQDDAQIIQSIHWSCGGIVPETVEAAELFVVYMPEKNLAFLAVSDENDNWVEVIYNNAAGDKGWIKKSDPYRFSSWINFFNMYGNKYGLNLLGGVPAAASDLHSAPDEFSQVVGRLNHPQKINLNAIRGNWALVSVYDMDRVPKTGYIRWRADNGVKYLFPAMK
ncbi:MAG: hypothetical protein LBK53_01230 [Heliobacteriaceae bacterium]|jgi:hypothetical protein|nr:hypothetical protein [Heliobacteriaceae bacterium]